MLYSDKIGRCWLKKVEFGYEIIFVRRGGKTRQVMGRCLGPEAFRRACSALLEVVAQNNAFGCTAHYGVA